MSDLSDYRDAFHHSVAEAHGLVSLSAPVTPVLPVGSVWAPYTPKPGPMPPRTRRPATEFAELCDR